MKEAIMNILAANMFAYLVNTCSQQKYVQVNSQWISSFSSMCGFEMYFITIGKVPTAPGKLKTGFPNLEKF